MYNVRNLAFTTIFFAFNAISPAYAKQSATTYPELNTVRAILSQPENDINIGNANLVIDKIVDPAINVEENKNKMDEIIIKIRSMLNKNASDNDKVLAIKKYLYQSGAWNNYHPYHYDFKDPLGTEISNKLIPNYIKSKKGNCVSMPFLFIILGERLGLNVTASTAPLHVFVKYTDKQTGSTVNLEATSGANPTRDEWYRKQMPMTDEAIANGLYLRKLTKKETVVVMASVLVEHYIKIQEYNKAVALADLQLEFYPKYDSAMLYKGSAYYKILKNNFLDKYTDLNLIPFTERSYFQSLSDNNRYWFSKAESLGWREPSVDYEKKYLENIKRESTGFH